VLIIAIFSRHREDKLRQEYDMKQHELVKTHDREQKQLVEEFTTAHESLKTRLAESQTK
jgi:hypothetical protein